MAALVRHVRTKNVDGNPERPAVSIDGRIIGMQWDVLVLKVDPRIVNVIGQDIGRLRGSELLMELTKAANFIEGIEGMRPSARRILIPRRVRAIDL